MTLVYSKSPYRAFLLEDDGRYRRWINNVERGSMNTASVYFRRMGNICGQFKTTPSGLARLSPAEATNLVFDLIESCERVTRVRRGLHFYNLLSDEERRLFAKVPKEVTLLDSGAQQKEDRRLS